MKIAQRFIAGFTANNEVSPVGTADERHAPGSAVPTGLGCFPVILPQR
ncbi:MAG: hypothetical protein H7Z38_07975 [Rubrivivax sp.]|nr:hypothetical protein [Pyrinomonadaceae bacterium]